MRRLIGTLLALAALLTLFFNEFHSVRTERSLAEGAAVVHAIPATLVQEKNEGRLVHFSGPVVTAGPVRDPLLGIAAPGLQLVRYTEMFQWREVSHTSHRGATQPADYTYETGWYQEVQNSQNFRSPSGHENPNFLPYPSATLSAQDATVGAFQIPPRLLASLHGPMLPVPLPDAVLAQVNAAILPGAVPAQLAQNYLYFGPDPAAARVGDIRVRFTVLPLGELSIVAQQSGQTVEPFSTQAGHPVELVELGRLSAREMFTGALRENTVLTWVLRVGGGLLLWLAAYLVLKPRHLGNSGFRALVVAAVSASATIAFGWLFARPFLSLTLLALLAVIAGWLIKWLRRPKAAARTPPASAA